MARCGRHGETVNDGVISTPPQITTAAHLPSPSSFESNPIIGTHVCCDFEHYNSWIDVLSIDIISLAFSHPNSCRPLCTGCFTLEDRDRQTYVRSQIQAARHACALLSEGNQSVRFCLNSSRVVACHFTKLHGKSGCLICDERS
jgi:hypothetical protein